MADPKARVLPVFRPRVPEASAKRVAAPIFATTRAQTKPDIPPRKFEQTLFDNVVSSDDDDDSTPDAPSRKPQKRRVLIFDEAELEDDEMTPNFPAAAPQEPEPAKRTTVLRVKRKRDEATLDAIVLEAPASKKREIEQLESFMKVMNIRKDSQGVQHEHLSSVQTSNDAKLHSDIIDPSFAASGTQTDVDSLKERDFKRRVFRYIGTVNSSGKFTNDEVQQRVAEMKNERTPMKANNLGEDSREARFAASRSDQATARFRQMNRIRRAAAEDAEDRSLNVLELTSASSGPDQEQKQSMSNTGHFSFKRAPGLQLPVIRRGKAKPAENSDDYVFDYFVYDSKANESDDLNSASAAVVHVENFDESLLDDYVPSGEYSDKEFDSDDSQNKDWDYGSESEGDEENSSDSDADSDSGRDERRRAFVDPFASIKHGTRKGNEEEEEEGGGDGYEDGVYNSISFKNRRLEDDAGSSSDDDDGFDHFGDAYVHYEEQDDLSQDESMDAD